MRLRICLAVLLAACLGLGSCQRTSLKIGKSNKVFGKLPALSMAEAEAEKRLRDAIQLTTDGREAIRYDITLKDLQKQVQERITAEWKEVEGREVPVENASGLNYRVTRAVATGWVDSTRTVQITCQVEPTGTGLADTACYLSCVKSDGTTLAVARIGLPNAPTKGEDSLATLPAVRTAPFEMVYNCSFGGVNLPDFTRFDRLVFIPRAKYEELWNLANIRRPAQP